MYGKKRQFGNIGEAAVANYLEKDGFSILSRNYLKKGGEIDIVAERSGIVHFVEVKTVSRENLHAGNRSFSRGTWRPEENVHAYKLKKLQRAIQIWLSETGYDGDFQIDIASVELDLKNNAGTVSLIENVILE